jgi:hypothetical protein
VTRNSSGESSGDIRNDGNNRTASLGLPAWIPASTSAAAANGCGRAARNAWLGLFTVSSESSAHKHKPFKADQNPCRTSIPLLFRGTRRQTNERWTTEPRRRRSTA